VDFRDYRGDFSLLNCVCPLVVQATDYSSIVSLVQANGILPEESCKSHNFQDLSSVIEVVVVIFRLSRETVSTLEPLFHSCSSSPTPSIVSFGAGHWCITRKRSCKSHTLQDLLGH
jgi:hypothetical protein